MKLVTDTNVLFSFFNEKSAARRLALRPNLELCAPVFSLQELKEHKGDIIERFSLSEPQYSLVEKLLSTVVRFSSESWYSEFLAAASRVSPDHDDTDFFALALKLKCPLWPEEKALKRQSMVEVLTTKELLEKLGVKEPGEETGKTKDK